MSGRQGAPRRENPPRVGFGWRGAFRCVSLFGRRGSGRCEERVIDGERPIMV